MVAMFVTTLIVTGMLGWVLATMLIDAWRRRSRQPRRSERLRPFRSSIGDEAERWLRRQP